MRLRWIVIILVLTCGWLWLPQAVYADNCSGFSDCYYTVRTALGAVVGVALFAVLITFGLDLLPGMDRLKNIIHITTPPTPVQDQPLAPPDAQVPVGTTQGTATSATDTPSGDGQTDAPPTVTPQPNTAGPGSSAPTPASSHPAGTGAAPAGTATAAPQPASANTAPTGPAAASPLPAGARGHATAGTPDPNVAATHPPQSASARGHATPTPVTHQPAGTTPHIGGTAPSPPGAAGGHVDITGTATPADASSGRVDTIGTATPADAVGGRIDTLGTPTPAHPASGRLDTIGTATPADGGGGQMDSIGTATPADLGGAHLDTLGTTTPTVVPATAGIDAAAAMLAFNAWIATLPRRTTPNNRRADAYKRQHAGPERIRLQAGTEHVWADGVRPSDAYLLVVKYIDNGARSPFTPGSSMPTLIRDQIVAEVDDEFRRFAAVLDAGNQPVQGVEVITNDSSAVPFFEHLLQKHGLPGQVVVRP